MTLDPESVAAVTFDSFSTLVDPRSAATVLEGRVADPEAVAAEWHDLAVRYATLSNHLDVDRTYTELHRDALAHLLAERGVAVEDADLNAMTAVYHDLDPFDDVAGALARLDAAGYDLAVLSNGEPAALDSLLDVTGVRDRVVATVSADEVGAFKPAAELYAAAADRLDAPVDAVAHVTAGWGDVMGAVNAGMDGVWLNRDDDPWPRFDGDPTLAVGTLHGVADALDAPPA